jgi:hypothetical protein
MTRRYTGEALAADSAALSAAGSAAEEALALHRSALAVLDEGWGGESGSAAIDLVRRQCDEAADLVEALHGAAAELRALRDSLSTLGAGYDGGAGPIDTVDGAAYPQPSEYAQAAARLSDRAAPVFATPAPPMPPAALSSPAVSPAPAMPAWPPSPGSPPVPNLGAAAFPNLGSTVAGLVAQIADVLSADAPEADSLGTDTRDAEPPDQPEAERGAEPEAERGAEPPDQPEAERGAEPGAEPDQKPSPTDGYAPTPTAQPPVLPAAVPTPQPDGAVPQQESPPMPLLAAELPPPAEPPPAEPPTAEPPPPPGLVPAVPSDGKTPCEIAADELPQVGQ